MLYGSSSFFVTNFETVLPSLETIASFNNCERFYVTYNQSKTLPVTLI